MMKKLSALVLGGNRYFGKRLVENLVQDGYQVTVLNRGLKPQVAGTALINCDRTNASELKNKTQGLHWDVIFDQICMTAEDSLASNEILIPKTSRYIMVSSKSVYGVQAHLTEGDYDPYHHIFAPPYAKAMEDYAEAKRQAEAALLQHKSSCLVSTVRIPFVLGTDDYTGRLSFHLQRVIAGQQIYFPNIEAKVSFIHAPDAARCIQKLAETNLSGPINFASEPVRLADLVQKIELITERKAHLATEGDEKNHSPYGVDADWYMSVQKAEENDIKCTPVWKWLDPLLMETYQQLQKGL